MFLIQKVEELVVTYDDGRKNIGEFILKNMDKIHTYLIKEIATHTYTSKASIVRFAKTLGYEGWKDLKKDLIREGQVEKEMADVDFNYPFQKGDTTSDIATKIASLQIKTIEDTRDHLDLDQVVRCTNLIVRARRVMVFGISPNTGVAELFRRKMLSIGKVVEISNSREMGMQAMRLDQHDVAIIVSYSGNNASVEPLNIVPYLRENNVPLIVIMLDFALYSLTHYHSKASTHEWGRMLHLDSIHGSLFRGHYFLSPAIPSFLLTQLPFVCLFVYIETYWLSSPD